MADVCFQKPEAVIYQPSIEISRRNFDQKQLKVGYKVSLSKNFQRQSCSTIKRYQDFDRR